jgi:hypothetical protein
VHFRVIAYNPIRAQMWYMWDLLEIVRISLLDFGAWTRVVLTNVFTWIRELQWRNFVHLIRQ